MKNKTNVIAIIGPTAVGKTIFSLELARKINAEIISVDSRQVYRYLDVGTDKVDLNIRREIPHHLIDIVDPDQIYSAADFTVDATDSINRIKNRGKVPLLIGGTPFYYKALTGALSENLPKNVETRMSLEDEINNKGLLFLYNELSKIDPSSAAKIHQNDSVRIMRALEIYRITGKNASWWYKNQKKLGSLYNIFYIGLIRSRETLYKNIEKRVKIQFASGYPEEVKWLLDNGYSPKLTSLQGFGYRELAKYLQGECSLADAIKDDIKFTKAFSRRQMTWFKHFEPVKWYDFDSITITDALKDAIELSNDHLKAGA